MLIIALDYDYAPSSELTCTRDARTMYRMAGRAGVDDITIITDKDRGTGFFWMDLEELYDGPGYRGASKNGATMMSSFLFLFNLLATGYPSTVIFLNGHLLAFHVLCLS